jgi:hypothetical protein
MPVDPVLPQFEVVLGDICLRLTYREIVCGVFLLLALLMHHFRRIVSRKLIFKEV